MPPPLGFKQNLILIAILASFSPLSQAEEITTGSISEIISVAQQGGNNTIKINQDIDAGSQGIVFGSGDYVLDGQQFSLISSASTAIRGQNTNSLTIKNFGVITFDENGNPIDGEGGLRNTKSAGQYLIYIDTSVGNLILDSVVFANNAGTQPGETTVSYKGHGGLIIKNSVFINNRNNINSPGGTMNFGQKIAIISNSLYKNNYGGWHGGALNFGGWPQIGSDVDWTASHFFDQTNFIENSSGSKGGAAALESSREPVTFRDSSFIGNTATNGGGAIYIENTGNYNVPLNIIADQRDVQFTDNNGFSNGNDILLNRGTVNLNTNTGRHIVFNGGIYGEKDVSQDVININKSDVQYFDSIESFDSNSAQTAPTTGEVRFNAPVQNVTVNLYGGTLSLLKAGDVMRTSVLNFEGLSTLNSQNEELQELVIGQIGFRSNANWSVDVDLNQALADRISLADSGVVENATQSTLQVSDWQVLEDDLSKTQVTVNLSADQRLNESNLGLAESGKSAQGPVYLWDVEYLGNGDYRFSRAGGTTDPEPEDFNPEVYGDTVASAGITVIQHSITEGIFANYRDAMTLVDEKPEKDPWWVKTIGSTLNMQPKNFGTIDLDYAVAMIGHNFETLNFADNSHLDFGIYGGWVGAKHEYVDNNKIRQNGGFLGGSSFYQKESLWLGLNLNVGWMDNDFTSRDGRADSEMPWLGIGATAGYTFNLPTYRMKIQPSLSASYVLIDNDHYTTARGANVEMDKVHSWELSPGLTVSKTFSNGISAEANVRYAWVDESSGKLTAKDTIGLPAIAFDDYVEYGIAMQKVTDQTTWKFGINRNDMGREGWSGNIYYGWKF